MKIIERRAELDPVQGMRERCAQLGIQCEVPIITKAVPLRYDSLIIEVGSQRNAVLEITMPCGQSKLLWMPWLPDQVQPQGDPGEYQHVNFGAWAIMPRRTKCYDSTYAFSGQVHPVEKTTPPEITALYKITSEIFQLQEPAVPNMCLENNYRNGREYISEHSDDERQFGSLKDVFCWSVGCARPAIFKTRGKGDGRQVLEILLPAGLYVMQGREFQQRYSHEFPQVHEKLFKRLVRLIKDDSFPTKALSERGAPMTGLVQAEWIQAHRQQVEQLIRTRKRTIRDPTVAEELQQFSEWIRPRISYTLRNFGH